MTEQLTLTGDPAGDQILGVNQALVLKRMREWGRIEPDEAGALVHASRGRHSEADRCQWCTRDGRAVLASLSRLGHKNGRPGSKRAGGVDPATSDFPEGF